MICNTFLLFYTRWQCVWDVKMSLLRQLPLVDSRLFPLANSKITCWCISYCCSGDVVIYSPAFFMSTFILISSVQNSSFSSSSISFGVMHLLTYNERRFFCTHRRKEVWYITEKKWSLHRKSYPMIFGSMLKTQHLFSTAPAQIIFLMKTMSQLTEQLNIIFHSGDW